MAADTSAGISNRPRVKLATKTAASPTPYKPNLVGAFTSSPHG